MINRRTKDIVVIGIFAALSWVISLFSFPILAWVPFLKIDFSDIPIILGMYIYGPFVGIMIASFRSLLSYAMSGGEAGFPIGDITAFIATLSFTLPIYYIINNHKLTKWTIGLSGFIATVSLTAVLTVLNWKIVAPMYMYVMGFSVGPIREYLILSVIPFNLIKGIIVSIVFYTVYLSMSEYLLRLKLKPI